MYWLNNSGTKYMSGVCMATVKVLKNALCSIMGYVVAMETCYVTFIDVCFCNVNNIGTLNVCANFEINRYNIDEFREYAKIVCFIWRHVTKKRYVTAAMKLLIDMSIRNILQSTRNLYGFLDFHIATMRIFMNVIKSDVTNKFTK